MLDVINILGYEYDIRYQTGEEIAEELHRGQENIKEGLVYDGAVCSDEQLIYLNEEIKQLPIEKHLEVFIHECIHAVSDKMCIGLEEREVELLGNGLAPVILQLIQGAEQPRYLMAEEEREERLKALDEKIGYYPSSNISNAPTGDKMVLYGGEVLAKGVVTGELIKHVQSGGNKAVSNGEIKISMDVTEDAKKVMAKGIIEGVGEGYRKDYIGR